MRFFRDVRGFTCLTVISSVMGIINVALFVMWPSQVIYIFGSTSKSWEETAWLSSTAAFGAWAGIVFVGPFYNWFKRLRWQLIVGSVWIRMGEVMTMLMVQYVVSDQDLGIAFEPFSDPSFTAAFLSVSTKKLPGQLQAKVVPAVLETDLPETSITSLLTAVAAGSQEAILAVPGMTSKLLSLTNITVSQSYSAAYPYVYYMSIVLGGAGIIGAVCLRDFNHYLTDHVSRQIHAKEETEVDPLQNVEPAANGGSTGSESKKAGGKSNITKKA
ncbi:hypothetical protein AJ79_07913 [Helicocarpus griseus UAMH5409]|uniref:Major facilitator superfamily (MFS) profile domain-containing protein n=1 Tax=Helicocarpus griseus UAMH5409 TaxID=1447875 RepID=A0A2B7WXS3_9EURO|nr:hypothetical protein AJ79_07913 [Helicocarpus griseus UAMH5409]